jgi:hypothetical protein
LLPFLGFALAIAPSLIVVWYRRVQLEAADYAVVTGCALTVLMMTGPWFSPDKSMRFYLIAFLPAIWVVSFGLTHMERNVWRQTVLGMILLTGLGGSALILIPGGKPILEDATMVELENLAGHIQDRDHTLVVADHGVEWWGAWFLHTHIAQPQALSQKAWGRYKTVLFLKVKTGVVSLPGRGGPGPNRKSRPPPGHPMPLPGIAKDAELIYDGATLRLERIDPTISSHWFFTF